MRAQVDMVVCSAGIALPKTFEDTTPEEFENVIKCVAQRL